MKCNKLGKLGFHKQITEKMTKARSKSRADTRSESLPALKRDGKSSLGQRTGRITRNPFLNFLRDMRKNAQGMSPMELSMKGAEIWRGMTKSQKEPYCQLARQAARRRRRRSRRRRRHRRRSRTVSSERDDEAPRSIGEVKFTEARRRRRRSKSRRSRRRRRRR
ncbi:protamine [Anthonomus grandis grandis]|uniref:protamine n=1 Tax=Anthonomus grandis grandis TaxID=2921223 RepID=UPI0021662808|nr:protamine [Anthonomus grandis grandis]